MIKVWNKKNPFVSCRRGSCKKANLGLQCEIGLRTRTFHILSGSVLSVWSKVESVLAGMPGGSTSKMQIIRLKTDCGQRIVGKLYISVSFIRWQSLLFLDHLSWRFQMSFSDHLLFISFKQTWQKTVGQMAFRNIDCNFKKGIWFKLYK